MKKQILSAFLAFCVLLTLCPAPTRAATIVASGPCGAENEADLIWTLDENGLLTFVGGGAMEDYNYESSRPWHGYRSQINAVSLPSGLTNIGAEAFSDLDGVTEINIPDTVASIGACAFSNCDNLTTLNLPDGLTSIGGSAFFSCPKLESLTVPASVTTLGSYAFSNCANLTVTVRINDALTWTLDNVGNLKLTGDGAMNNYHSEYDYNSREAHPVTPWYDYRSQIKSVLLPSGLTNIGAYAFSDLDGVTGIDVPDTVISIESRAFAHCSSMVAANLAEGLSSISESAFADCSKLESLTIPNSVTTIGAGAFRNCPKLTATVYEGSYGQRYCLLNSIRHNAIPPHTYTITFHPNGGELSQTTKTLTGNDAVYGELPTPTRDGYAFAGWHTATDYGARIDENTPFAEKRDQTLYAVWLKTYAITFDLNGGEAPQTSKTLTDDDAVYGELPAPARDGYDFMGWHTAANGGERIDENAPFTEKRDQTLYAIWLKLYAITFDPNGGETPQTSKILTDNDTAYGELPTPARDGYIFAGWHTATEGGERIDESTPFAEKRDQTLYAVWTNTHTVTLEANGGTVEPSSVTVEEGGVYGALPEPSRDGCVFLGWFTDPSDGTQVTAETEVRLTANQTLYAHWRATNAPEFSSNGAAVTDVREMSSESELEGTFTVPDAADPDAFRTATAFCVLYDKDGLMVHLQSWDVDVSDARNIHFTGSVRIPEGAQVSEIKIIVLSDELVPLQAAGTL